MSALKTCSGSRSCSQNLDALSVAFQDRSAANVDIVTTALFLEGGLILLQFYFVWLRKGERAGRAGR
jgi:hypothetical protein